MKEFATRLLPESEERWPRARAQPPDVHPGWGLDFGLAKPVAITLTPNDLAVLYGRGNRLPTVKEVAELPGVCAATAYRPCDSGELPHSRVVQSIRIRPADLAACITQWTIAADEPEVVSAIRTRNRRSGNYARWLIGRWPTRIGDSRVFAHETLCAPHGGN